jgi:nucleotidyltransferase substrate binding protein (TIGR01987 family)
LRKAYAASWIKDETLWLQMLNDRNETSHEYDEDKAKKIYQHISAYYPALNATFEFLKNRIKD